MPAGKKIQTIGRISEELEKCWIPFGDMERKFKQFLWKYLQRYSPLIKQHTITSGLTYSLFLQLVSNERENIYIF